MSRTFVRDNLDAPTGPLVCSAYTFADALIGDAVGVQIDGGTEYRATIEAVTPDMSGYVRWTDAGVKVDGSIEAFGPQGAVTSAGNALSDTRAENGQPVLSTYRQQFIGVLPKGSYTVDFEGAFNGSYSIDLYRSGTTFAVSTIDFGSTRITATIDLSTWTDGQVGEVRLLQSGNPVFAKLFEIGIPTAAEVRAEMDNNSEKLDVPVSTRLAPTTPNRTLEVGPGGAVIANPVVIRFDMALTGTAGTIGGAPAEGSLYQLRQGVILDILPDDATQPFQRYVNSVTVTSDTSATLTIDSAISGLANGSTVGVTCFGKPQNASIAYWKGARPDDLNAGKVPADAELGGATIQFVGPLYRDSDGNEHLDLIAGDIYSEDTANAITWSISDWAGADMDGKTIKLRFIDRSTFERTQPSDDEADLVLTGTASQSDSAIALAFEATSEQTALLRSNLRDDTPNYVAQVVIIIDDDNEFTVKAIPAQVGRPVLG